MPTNNRVLIIKRNLIEAHNKFIRTLAAEKTLSFSDGNPLPDDSYQTVLLLFPKENFEGDIALKIKAFIKYGKIVGINSTGKQKIIGLQQLIAELFSKNIKSIEKIIKSAFWLAFAFKFYILRTRPTVGVTQGRIKVLHLVKSGKLSGITIMVRNLLECVDKQIFEPSVCFLEGGQFVDEFRKMGFEVMVINKRDYDIDTVAILKKLMEEKQIKILHAHEFKESIYGRFAAGMAGVPVNIAHFHGGGKGDWRKLVPFGRLSLRFTDAVLALTGLMKKEISDGYYGYRADPMKIFRFPNCVDTELFLPKDKATAKSQFNIPDGILVIGMTARLSVEKGHEVLFKALKHLKDLKLEFLCLLIGDGPIEGLLKEKTKEMGISDYVVFMGERRDIHELLPVFDIYIQPSIWHGESFSLSTVEAMACEVPVIASRIGGLPEVVDHGICGFLFNPEDIDELTGYIKLLLDEPDKAAEMGKNARMKAERDFSRISFKDRVNRLYFDLLDMEGH